MRRIDLKTFKESWWSTTPLTLEAEEWLYESHSNPASFLLHLGIEQKSLSSGPVNSTLGKSYDFYNDCLLRHTETNKALIVFEKGGNSSSWTYKQLHRLVNHLLKKWEKYELKPRQLITIALPFGIEYLVALLAALRLGLVISSLPPSPFISQKRVEQIIDQMRPALVVTNHSMAGGVTESEDSLKPISYVYSSDETVQIPLALYRQSAHTMRGLDAHTTYCSALRDGIVAFQLKPGMIWTAPLTCPLSFHPFGIIATLLCGATYVHVPEAAMRAEPTLLKDEKIHGVGVSASLLELWSRMPCAPSKMKYFYTSIFDRSLEKWKRFVKLNKLEKIPSFQAWIDNSLGGALLVSQPTLSVLGSYGKPSLGSGWFLQEIDKEMCSRSSDFGLFGQDYGTTNLLFAYIDKCCLLSGTLSPSRNGVTIPIEIIEQLVSQCQNVESCVVSPLPKMGNPADHQIIFLVFVDPLAHAHSAIDFPLLTETIHRLVAEEVGAAFIADRIEYYPIVPNMRDGVIDRSWCINQYKSGLLEKKKNLLFYQLSSRLKKLLLTYK